MREGALRKGIAALESLPLWDGLQFTPMEEVQQLLSSLGDPQDAVSALHVAGTNGKGSVCAFLSSILYAQGLSVGQFASPHLSHITERFLINGSPVEVDALDASLTEVIDAAAHLGLSPSYFVVGTAAAFLLFSRLKLDWMVIEVGLGGLYDATNAMRSPKASIVTTIEHDHAQVLGNTLAEIARNKAGIIKPGVPVFVGKVDSSAKEVIKKQAIKLGTKAEFSGEEFIWEDNQRRLVCQEGSIKLDCSNSMLDSEYQRENAALAARTALSLGLTQESINQGLRAVRWPGRLEHFRVLASSMPGIDFQVPEVNVLIDAAHNPDGMKAMLSYLRGYAADKKDYSNFVFVLSMLQRKDWEKMLELLKDFAQQKRELGMEVRIIFTRSENPHCVDPKDLRAKMGEGEIEDKAEQAFKCALLSADAKTLVVVSGSIFLLGEIRPLIAREPFRTIGKE